MNKIHSLVVGRLQTNCFIVQSQAEAIIVDPGDEPERILRFIKDINATPTRIVATHTHFDHVLGVDGVRKGTKAPFMIHRSEEHTSELQSQSNLVCRLLLEKKKSPYVSGLARLFNHLTFANHRRRVMPTV